MREVGVNGAPILKDRLLLISIDEALNAAKIAGSQILRHTQLKEFDVMTQPNEGGGAFAGLNH